MLLSSIVLCPLLAAAALLFVPGASRVAVRIVASCGALGSLLGVLKLALAYDPARSGVQFRERLELLPSLGVSWKLGVDGWGICLLLLTALILFAGVWASATLERRSKEFYVLLLVLATGVLGVFVSLDLFLFFLFYEVAVLPMYLLIGVWGSSRRVAEAGPFRFALRILDLGGREYAAMKLTLVLLAGSALVLAGMLAMVEAAGQGTWDLEVLQAATYGRGFQLVVFPLLWVGFGTLAGLFPFHTWSPDGHASAPTAVSMLHAGVLMKLGAFGVIRVGMVCLPQGAGAWAFAVGLVATINIVWGAMSAMGQEDLKYVVAYSSVSHMGIVMLGAATMELDGWNGAVFQMVAHGLMTGVLFALVGLVYERAHSRMIFQMGGFAARMPWVAVFFTIACLSSLGLPGLAGFPAELLVFIGAWESRWSWWAVPAVAGAFITALYVLRVCRAVFWGEGPAERFSELAGIRGPEWVAPVLLCGGLLVLGLAPELLLRYIDPVSAGWLRPAVAAATGGILP